MGKFILFYTPVDQKIQSGIIIDSDENDFGDVRQLIFYTILKRYTEWNWKNLNVSSKGINPE